MEMLGIDEVEEEDDSLISLGGILLGIVILEICE
jgi:hypothetical protein